MLILNENGKVTDRTDKSIDALKRENYKHSSQEVLKEEEKEELESFVDSLEELEDGEDSPPEADLDPAAVEIAVEFAEFKVNFVKAFGEDELSDAFLQFEDFFSSKGVDASIDLSELDKTEEGIPGEESSEQSIVTSETEDETH